AEREVTQPHGRAHPRALRLTDHRVMRDPAAIGVERLRLAQEDEMALSALIDEQHLLTVLERQALVHAVASSRGAASITTWPSASNAISFVCGLTRSEAARNPLAAALLRAAGLESAMTQQCYTTARHEPTRARRGTPHRPGARSRLLLRARSRRHPPLLHRRAGAHGDRHRQERADRVLPGGRPSPRRLLRAGPRRRPRPAAQGRAGPLSRGLRRGHNARGSGLGAPLGGVTRADTVRGIRARLLRARPRRPRDRALRGARRFQIDDVDQVQPARRVSLRRQQHRAWLPCRVAWYTWWSICCQSGDAQRSPWNF